MFVVTGKNGIKVVWKDGKYICDDKEFIERVRKRGKYLSDRQYGVYFGGTVVGTCKGMDYEKNVYTAYGLLDMCIEISKAEGDVPSILDLYPDTKKGMVY